MLIWDHVKLLNSNYVIKYLILHGFSSNLKYVKVMQSDYSLQVFSYSVREAHGYLMHSNVSSFLDFCNIAFKLIRI